MGEKEDMECNSFLLSEVLSNGVCSPDTDGFKSLGLFFLFF